MSDCCGEQDATARTDAGPQTDTDICPRCGKKGRKVGVSTARSLLGANHSSRLVDGQYYLCLTPSCDVAYYNNDAGQALQKQLLSSPVWFKEPGDDVPICYCSSLSRKRILEAVEAGYLTIAEIRAHTGATRTGECAKTNPTGKCCHKVFQQVIDSALAGRTIERTGGMSETRG